MTSLRNLVAIAAVATAAAAATAVPAMAADTASFQSPSGNIRCAYVSGQGVACVSRSNGRYAMLRAFGNSRTGFTSSSLPGGRTLGYGYSWRASTFSCTSEVNGVSCRSSHTGHGFFLARETSYRW